MIRNYDEGKVKLLYALPHLPQMEEKPLPGGIIFAITSSYQRIAEAFLRSGGWKEKPFTNRVEGSRVVFWYKVGPSKAKGKEK